MIGSIVIENILFNIILLLILGLPSPRISSTGVDRCANLHILVLYVSPVTCRKYTTTDMQLVADEYYSKIR